MNKVTNNIKSDIKGIKDKNENWTLILQTTKSLKEKNKKSPKFLEIIAKAQKELQT